MDKITIGEALSWLGPLFGAGGLTAIVVAWLGTRKPTAPAASPGQLGIQALLADHLAMDRLTHEVSRLGDELAGVRAGINRYCDLMDISQALDRLHRDRD